jgi:hypothetical protein
MIECATADPYENKGKGDSRSLRDDNQKVPATARTKAREKTKAIADRCGMTTKRYQQP